MSKIRTAVVAILIAQGAGLIGALFTGPAIPVWYAGLQKPVFSPPNWLFGPVWTLLFFLMGIASFLVWQKDRKKTYVRNALYLYGFQLILNTLWSILFFGFRSPLLALLEMVVLWTAILVTLIKFSRIHRTAGLLLVPYLVWVSYAFLLNLAIVLLNP